MGRGSNNDFQLSFQILDKNSLHFFTTPNIKFKVYESSYRMGPVGCETNFYLNIATLINLHV
jgi:hypothetical protein